MTPKGQLKYWRIYKRQRDQNPVALRSACNMRFEDSNSIYTKENTASIKKLRVPECGLVYASESNCLRLTRIPPSHVSRHLCIFWRNVIACPLQALCCLYVDVKWVLLRHGDDAIAKNHILFLMHQLKYIKTTMNTITTTR